MSLTAIRRIDPLAPGAPVYRDELVEIGFDVGHRPGHLGSASRTRHFDVYRDGGNTAAGPTVHIRHRLRAAELTADIAQVVADELFDTGLLEGARYFERIITGIVVSSHPDPLMAWERFYRQTLQKLAVLDRARPKSWSLGTSRHGALADYAPVYRHAEGLVTGDAVLELGSCFGFFALRLAAKHQTTAIDITAGSTRLLAAMALSLGLPVTTLTADAADVPLPDEVADTVVTLHLLEHLDETHGHRVLAEAVRLARRRVVVATPLEFEPDPLWGHVRTISTDDLNDWGACLPGRSSVHEFHGGWLVLDL